MIELVKSDGWSPIRNDSYCITQKYDGIDELEFEISIFDPLYPVIAEEDKIYETTLSQYYCIRKIDAGQETATITCTLFVDAWKSWCKIGYSNGTKTVQDTVSGILPSGWSVSDSVERTDKRLVELEGGTPYEILMQCEDDYGCTFRFDTQNKVIKIIWPDSYTDSGKYMIETANLRKKPEFKSSSESLVNCIYPFGKDGLNISSVNDGKKYVENYGYTSKPLCAYWSDERYEDAASLKKAAEDKLVTLSVPDREWEVYISKYDLFDIEMFEVIKVFDMARNVYFYAQVNEKVIYPYDANQNEVTVKRFGTNITKTSSSTNSIRNIESKVSSIQAKEAVVGTVIKQTATATSVATATIASIASITLPAGTWVVTGQVQFPSNETGRRSICIGSTSGSWDYTRATVGTAAVSGASTNQNCTYISSSTSSVTLYLTVYQTSGSTMTLTASNCFIQAVRIV